MRGWIVAAAVADFIGWTPPLPQSLNDQGRFFFAPLKTPRKPVVLYSTLLTQRLCVFPIRPPELVTYLSFSPATQTRAIR